LLKSHQLEQKSQQTLKDCFTLIPNQDITLEPRQASDNVDAEYLLKINGFEKRILVALTPLGTPKRIRAAVNQLRAVLNNDIDPLGVVVAPYIADRSAQICKNAGMGFVDLSGNFWIAFDSFFLNRENMPNQYPLETSLSTLYAPKTERVLRVLLTYPYKTWKTTALAEEADISLGMITHIRRRLEEEAWVEKHEVGFSLSAPEALLADWVEAYDFDSHEQMGFYTMDPLPEVEQRLNQICKTSHIKIALTGFSAANHLAPMVKGQRSTVYIAQALEEIAKKAGLKPVNSGANIHLVQPYDEGVFWNSAITQKVQIATPVQIYLDLMQMHGRGEEAAGFLYQEVIQPAWQHQKSSMNPD
jgi:hypothetical protein